MKPVLYRPPSNWPPRCAFTVAAAIHVSALAFSPSNRSDTIGSEPIAAIDVEDPAPPDSEPLPETADLALIPAPSPEQTSDYFPDSQPTPAISRKPGPIRARTSSIRPTSVSGNGKASALNAPRPIYPYEARAHHITGSGLAVLQVDPASGAVTSATMAQTTGSPLLDRAAINAFEHWRFKRGTQPTVRIPITFTMFGAQL
jgi:TonB family protein